MADIAATDVTYTVQSQTISNMSVKGVVCKLVFGNGALTYPTGGIPLTKGKLGLPNSIMSLELMDLGTSGYMCSYDFANEKLRLFQRDSHTHNLLLKNAAVADGATTRVNAGANLLGANTGSDITVTGAGANGGVVNASAAALSELTGGSSAVANNTTIYVRASGF